MYLPSLSIKLSVENNGFRIFHLSKPVLQQNIAPTSFLQANDAFWLTETFCYRKLHEKSKVQLYKSHHQRSFEAKHDDPIVNRFFSQIRVRERNGVCLRSRTWKFCLTTMFFRRKYREFSWILREQNGKSRELSGKFSDFWEKSSKHRQRMKIFFKHLPNSKKIRLHWQLFGLFRETFHHFHKVFHSVGKCQPYRRLGRFYKFIH